MWRQTPISEILPSHSRPTPRPLPCFSVDAASQGSNRPMFSVAPIMSGKGSVSGLILNLLSQSGMKKLLDSEAFGKLLTVRDLGGGRVLVRSLITCEKIKPNQGNPG